MATILTPLIKGQTIRIDNHQQGTGTENDWSKEGVHFHKSCNKTKEKFDIIIPLNYPAPPKVKNLKTGKQCPIESMDSKVKKEIKEIFKSQEARDSFFNNVYKYLKDNFSNWSNNETDMSVVAERIGRAFGITLSDSPIITMKNKCIKCYVQRMIQHDNKTEYIMKFNFSKGYFQLGEKECEAISFHIDI